MTHVELKGLTKSYRSSRKQDNNAVDEIDLTVCPGELMALLGPSGCGKTTTLRMIAGLLTATAGDICFDGQSILHIPAEARGAVMVFQNHLLFPHMSVGDNVAFGLRMRKVSRTETRRRVADMLDLVQLSGFEPRRPRELSGGQQQRVALARALVIEPRLLLLDEPLANLDANLRLEMRKLIRTVQQTLGITTLFVTHDQEEAIMLADQMALMMQGRLLQVDSPRVLYEKPNSVTVARFFRNENKLPGIKRGLCVETEFGSLALSTCQHHHPDGKVWVTVRPEHLQLACETAVNELAGQIVEQVYMGVHLHLNIAIGEHVWHVHLPTQTTVANGDHCRLYLPPEHIWLLPA